jgi:hypothetical protein
MQSGYLSPLAKTDNDSESACFYRYFPNEICESLLFILKLGTDYKVYIHTLVMYWALYDTLYKLEVRILQCVQLWLTSRS